MKSQNDSATEVSLNAKQLAGGISQQPDHLMFPGQVKSASNVTFSLVDGISVRNGTRYIKEVTGLTSGATYRLHPIKRSDDEKYLLIYGAGVVKAYNTDGTACTFNTTSDAATYRDANTATADQMLMLTVADYTYFVNTTVATDTTLTDDYTITGEWDTYERMVSHTPADQTYHRVIKDGTVFSAGYYQYDVDGGTFGTGTFPALSGATNADPTGIWDTAGTRYGFKIRQQRRVSDTGANNILWDESDKTLTAPTAIWAEYAWQPGDEVEIVNGTGLMAGKVYDTGTYAYEVVEKISSTQLRLGPAVTAGGDQIDVRCRGIGTEHEVVYDPPTTAYATMFDVAAAIQQACANAGAYDTLCQWVSTGHQAGRFVLTCRWRGANAKIVRTFTPAGTVTDLSAAGQAFENATAVYTTGVTPGAGINRQRSIPVNERWKQVGAPNQIGGRLVATSMPFQIVRSSLNTFDFGVATWTDRFWGNDASNPAPSIFSRELPISSIFYMKGRLGLAGGPYVNLSESNNIGNFYQPTSTVNDSYPIDIEIGGDRVSNIKFVVPYRGVASVFTDGGEQFELSAGTSSVLTPETAGFDNTTSYYTLDVRPVAMGGLLFFLAGGNGRVQMLESFYDDNSAAVAASDNTAHVPTLILGAARMVTHEASRTVFILQPDNAGAIYVYRQFFDGLQKAQSAWSTWAMFPIASSTRRICDIAVIDNDLYLLMQRGSKFVIERMPMAGISELNLSYNLCGDTIMAITGVHSAGTTTWTLPDTFTDSTLNTAVLSNDFVGGEGTTVTVTPGSGVVTASGDYSGGVAYICRTYLASVGLARPFLRDQSGVAETDSGLQMKKMVVTTASPYRTFSTVMARSGSTTITFTYPGQRHSLDKAWQVWAGGDVERMSLSFTNSGVNPFTVSGIQYIVEHAEVQR